MDKELREDLLITALEGGSNYWYEVEENISTDIFIDKINNGLTLSIREEGTREFLGKINDVKCDNAIKDMKDNYPEHYANLFNESWDAETADVFFQLAIMGELVYG